MKKTRKGFTLVELLIVVAILATLSATMMVSMSGSTAKAKAATIASNVDACVLAVQKYYGDGLGEKYEKRVNEVIIAAIPKFGSFTTGTITYVLGSDPATNNADPLDYTKWTMTVSFLNDPEKAEIKTALEKIKGYDKGYTATSNADTFTAGPEIITNDASTGYQFQVNLFTGAITAVPTA